MVYDKGNDRANDMVIEEAKRRKLPPSRVRFEKSHPTITIRLKEADRDKLLEMSKRTGKSAAKLVQEALDPMKRDIEAAYNRGYDHGWGCFEYPCSICGEEICVDIKHDENIKQALLKAFKSGAHAVCIDKKSQDEYYERMKILTEGLVRLGGALCPSPPKKGSH